MKQIETVGNAVNSDCARRNGGQPSRRERAAAGGPVGRLRTDRAGARRTGRVVADGGRTGRAHAQTNQTIAFIIQFISIHLLNNFHELTPDICSPILTPPHLLALFATTFFFHGYLLLDFQSFLQFHDRATLVLERILLFVGS